MDWMRNCAAVIPCLNEAAHIGEVVTGVRRQLPTVFVVDDGSTDHTAEVAKRAGAEIIYLPRNCGKGGALRAGWRHARNRGFTWAFNLDGDGQHAPDDIPLFFQCAELTLAAMVVGNRLNRAETMPWLRRQTNRWMTQRLSRLVGVPLADSQCGFRLLNLDTVARLELTTSHFEIESELLVAFLGAGCRVEFVPVQVIYKSDASKIHPLLDGWRWARWWFAQRWSAAEETPAAIPTRVNHPAETHA